MCFYVQQFCPAEHSLQNQLKVYKKSDKNKRTMRVWNEFYNTRPKKVFKNSAYQVWPLHSLLAAHSGPWYLYGWLYGHGDEKGPAYRQQQSISPQQISFKWCGCNFLPLVFLCRCTQSSPPSKSCPWCFSPGRLLILRHKTPSQAIYRQMHKLSQQWMKPRHCKIIRLDTRADAPKVGHRVPVDSS